MCKLKKKICRNVTDQEQFVAMLQTKNNFLEMLKAKNSLRK